MSGLAQLVLKIRPASLASAVARVCGLDKRTLVQTENGAFYISPVTWFGSEVLQGTYEPQTVAILRRFLHPGGVFIDMGANEGYFSVVASKMVGESGKVISIEPQSRLQEVIQSNYAANQCANARLIRCVVSGKTEKVQLSLSPNINTGSSSLFRQTKYSLPTEEVQSYSLQDLMTLCGVAHCDLAKIDIEGAEYDLFESSREFLRCGIIRHIAIEIHHPILKNRGLAENSVHEQLLDCGYELNTDVERCEYPTIYSFRGK